MVVIVYSLKARQEETRFTRFKNQKEMFNINIILKTQKHGYI